MKKSSIFSDLERKTLSIFEKKDRLQNLSLSLWKEKNCCGLIAAATGVGKSRVGVLAAQYILQGGSCNIRIVVPTEKLRDKNWKEEFEKWGASDIYNQNVKRCCYASLNKQDDWADLVILDEAHNITPNNSEYFSKFKKKPKVLALTATPPKEKEKRDILNVLCPTVFTYTLDEGVADGIVTPYEIYIVDTTLNSRKKNVQVKLKDGREFWVTEQYRYDYLCSVIDKKRAEMAIESAKVKESLFKLHEMYGIVIETELNDFKKGKLKDLKVKYKNWEEGRYNAFKTWREAVQKFEWVEGRHKMAMLDRMRFIYNLESKKEVIKYLMDTFICEGERTLVFGGSIKQINELCGENTFHSGTKSIAYNKFVNEEISVLGVVEALNEGHNIPNVYQSIVGQVNSNDRDLIQRIGRNVRFKEDVIAKIFLVRCLSTQDEVWVEKATGKLDQSRIFTFDFEELQQILF